MAKNLVNVDSSCGDDKEKIDEVKLEEVKIEKDECETENDDTIFDIDAALYTERKALPRPEPADEDSLKEKKNRVERPKGEKTIIPTESLLERIKHKLRRQRIYRKLKKEKQEEKRKEKLFAAKKKMSRRVKGELREKRREAKKDNPQPHTIESMREKDITIPGAYGEEDLLVEESSDKYADYYNKKYVPKVLVTTSSKAHGKTIRFLREFALTIPNSISRWRNQSSVEGIIKDAKEKGFTDVLIVNEDRRGPNGLLVVHLPSGPTAYFRLSNVTTCKEMRRNIKNITGHRPELMLNNFKTLLGRAVGRMVGALYHYEPEFKARSLCTFHNQRDFIFFRHHRYEFKNETKKPRLYELGPRFTMKLQWIQEGAFSGDYEWTLKRRMLEKSRRAFHL